MPIPTLTTPPVVPIRRNMSQEVFELATANFLAYFEPFTIELTDMINWISSNASSGDTKIAQVAALLASVNVSVGSILPRAANTVLSVGDNAKTLVATAAFTQTLAAAATLGNGWFCYIRNQSTGNLSIDPNAGELINGVATLSITAGSYVMLVCDGVGFTLINLSSGASNYTLEQALRRAKNAKYY